MKEKNFFEVHENLHMNGSMLFAVCQAANEIKSEYKKPYESNVTGKLSRIFSSKISKNKKLRFCLDSMKKKFFFPQKSNSGNWV